MSASLTNKYYFQNKFVSNKFKGINIFLRELILSNDALNKNQIHK